MDLEYVLHGHGIYFHIDMEYIFTWIWYKFLHGHGLYFYIDMVLKKSILALGPTHFYSGVHFRLVTMENMSFLNIHVVLHAISFI